MGEWQDSKLIDAYEALYDLVKDLPDDTDSDAAVKRCMLRRFEEAVGKRITRLLYEKPEGQKIYGLGYDDAVRAFVAAYERRKWEAVANGGKLLTVTKFMNEYLKQETEG